MPKPGSGRPVSRPKAKPRRAPPQHVPGVPGFPVKVTFALREPVRYPFVLAGLMLGLAGALPAHRFYGWRFALPVALTGVLFGLLSAVFLRQDRCVEPGCGVVLRARVGICPGCGGTIIGHLESGGSPSEA